MWTCFPVYKNKKLAEAIHDRMVELGYKSGSSSLIDTVCSSPKNVLCISDDPNECNRIAWSTDYVNDNHVLGNTEILFLTDKYRVKSPIKVALESYTAEVTNVIKVGCTTITAEQVEELYQAFKKYNG